MPPIRVLIVDDDPLVAQALVDAIGSFEELQVVGVAVCGEDAIRRIGEARPDVALMDATMPGLGGLEATRRIRDLHPGTKVLILTAHGHDQVAKDALAAGAHGYLVKTCGLEVIRRSITLVYHGVMAMDTASRPSTSGQEPPARPAREFCPHLGITGRPDLQCSYASGRHCCFGHARNGMRGHPRSLAVEYQKEWCLTARYADCPEFVARPPSGASPS